MMSSSFLANSVANGLQSRTENDEFKKKKFFLLRILIRKLHDSKNGTTGDECMVYTLFHMIIII